MSESVWSWSADELVRRAGADAPAPGSGSVAAVAGAMGIALVRKAIVITGGAATALDERTRSLLERAQAAADADVEAFSAVIDARGMPRDDGEQRADRDATMRSALERATAGPIELVATLVDALAIAAEALPLVKHELESDVLAGADLVRGAAAAALRAVDLDLDALDRAGSPDVARLRARRDELVDALDERAAP